MTKSHPTYLRHKNGGGKIFDNSEVCEKSFADRLSVIRDESSVWSSRLEASEISAALVTNSVVKNSVIIAADVTGGMIERSIIACELITGNVRIKNCQILGKSRIVHSASCENVKFKNLTVKGNARLENWEQAEDDCFDGFHGYVSRGVWKRPPRVFRISDGITITESIAGFAYVHCREFPISHWLKIGNRYGAVCGWTKEQITACRKIMKILQRS